MNLSSHLQMPPAPLTPNSPNNTVPQGPRSAVGAAAAANSGFDFALVMAKQIERIATQERQHFAVDRPAATDVALPKQESHASDYKKTPARNSSPDETAKATEEKRDDAPRSTSRHTSQRAVPKQERTEVDALLEGLMQGQAVPAAMPGAETAPAVPQALTENNVGIASVQDTLTSPPTQTMPSASAVLHSMQISPQMRILTAPQPATTHESLIAFAQAMGLDEAAVESLMAQQPQGANAIQTLATGSGVPISTLNTAPDALMTQGQAPEMATAGTSEDMVALQLAAMKSAAQPHQPVSGAGLAAPASTLQVLVPGLTATDMAAITQVQITVLPAAVLPVNPATSTAVPSTRDMLSLMETGINEQDVDALLTRFSEETSQDGQTEQHASSDEGQHGSGFAQALSRTHTAAANTSVTNTSSPAKMSEVYDQLSDKMATEMAARMHKQLSDGEWKMKFALRPSNLGGVEIQLEMKDGQLDAVFHADNPLTRDLLQNSSQRLREALANFGINAGHVNVGQGGGNTAQNGSGNSGKQSQVRDNSNSQVNGNSSATSTASGRSKANASLLDLYA